MNEPRVALVTGAARGIGAAVAARFAGMGLIVVGADVDPSQVTDGAAVEQVDIRSGEQVEALVATTVQRHGRLDVLVNNAGINHRGSLAETSETDWLRLMDVNLNGTFRMSIAARPHLALTRGCVVNLASTAGTVAITGTAAYSVSKAAIIHLTKVTALEWAPDGIRANAVAPTIVSTEMTADVRADKAYMAGKVASIPLGRMVEPDEVVDAVAFLASSASSMITGQVLHVDGGVTIL